MDKRSEAWRAETEARLYLTWPRAMRQYQLTQIEKFRGPEAREKVRVLMEALMEKPQ